MIGQVLIPRLVITLLSVAVLRAGPLPIDQPDSKRQISYAVLGEDATSAHYYFFYSLPGADTLAKVRLLWNGGAQNKPTITDYYLDGSSIYIVERSAERHSLPELLKGQDAPSETVRERHIKSINDDALIDAATPRHLTTDERVAVSNLIHALSLIRKPVNEDSG